MNNTSIKKFLLQALNLVSSYLFDKSVSLEISAVGFTQQQDLDDETATFLKDVELRHAIACAKRLQEIVLLIERRPSSRRVVVRSESKGDVRGRIDFPLYIARRLTQVSMPRYYPVIHHQAAPQTPENTLVVTLFNRIATQLGDAAYPQHTAEERDRTELYNWVRSRLRRLPWALIIKLESLEYLQGVVAQRIRKHQTGNDIVYSGLLGWLNEWRADLSYLGDREAEIVVDGLLAFPQDAAFQNKVFEIWCLQEVARSLERCGCTLNKGPLSLHQRTAGPLYSFNKDSLCIDVWFQRQYPLTMHNNARWSYLHSNARLRGIPDIIVTTGKSFLIIDAKFRMVVTDTRAEETYKMLGYAENFRDGLLSETFHGLVIFIGFENQKVILSGPNNGRISLITVKLDLEDTDTFNSFIDEAIYFWLENIHDN